jgi:hypothetical protein
MRGVTPAGWKLVGMAMYTPVIGNGVYEATFDATESSGRMEQPGHGNLQAEKRRDVNQTLIETDSREDSRVLPAYVLHACLLSLLSGNSNCHAHARDQFSSGKRQSGKFPATDN